MTRAVEVPLWLLALIVLFAAVTFASHFLFPSVRWFLRRRAEGVVARLNERLTRPIEPFKLARRTDMIQRLVYDPAVAEAVVEHARKNGVREDVAFETARRYAREIVPGFSATAYFGFAIRAARLLSRSLYDVDADPDGARRALEGVPADATVIFVMNHRSNMDYVLVTYLAGRASALAYAVGEWARVFPLNVLIRALGGYFIRRRSRGDLYRRVLARYVQLAARAGVTQAVFPEGRLSLDGTLGPPKLGLLSYILSDEESPREVVFVPVGLAYDRVLEDRVLTARARDGSVPFRRALPVAMGFALKQVVGRLTRRLGKLGTAAVNFGEPVRLSEAGRDPEALGARLMEAIGRNIPALPVPLVCLALERAGGALDRDALIAAVEELDARLSEAPRPGADIVAEAEAALRPRNFIALGEAWSIKPGQEDLMAYYAHSLMHRLSESALAVAATPQT